MLYHCINKKIVETIIILINKKKYKYGCALYIFLSAKTQHDYAPKNVKFMRYRKYSTVRDQNKMYDVSMNEINIVDLNKICFNSFIPNF